MRLPMESERFFSAFTPLGYVFERLVMVSARELSSRSAVSSGFPMIPLHCVQTLHAPQGICV